MRIVLLIASTFALIPIWVGHALAAPLLLDSGNKQVQLIELYTSQGCSSCPPAEDFVSRLTDQPGLWTQRVPVAFHVDYWNYLGWPDPYSQKQFSQRQQQHRSEGNTSGVYTPGFLIDGKEWRGFFSGQSLPQQGGPAGRLTATIDQDTFVARYDAPQKALRIHVALLGSGIVTDVPRGENRGRSLQQDFTVLSYQAIDSDSNEWKGTLSLNNLPKAPQYAIALWITSQSDLKPLQAVGAWLEVP